MPVKFVSVDGWPHDGSGRASTLISATAHIMPRILAALTDSAKLNALVNDALSWSVMIDHIQGCSHCRAGLLSLVLVGDTQTDAFHALLAHAIATPRTPASSKRATSAKPPAGHDAPFTQAAVDALVAAAPDALALASYVAVAARDGRQAAQTRFPDVARHLNGCPLCRDDVVRNLASVAAFELAPRLERTAASAPNAPIGQPDTSTRAATAWRGWERAEARCLRLAQVIVAHVRSKAVRLTTNSAVVQLVAPTAPMSAQLGVIRKTRQVNVVSSVAPPEPADSGARATRAALEQGALVRLATPRGRPALFAHLRLRATYTGRISGELRLTQTTTSADERTPVMEASWRLERAHSPTSVLLSGQTDSQGIARFFLRQFGNYDLHLEVAGRSWILPLEMTREP